MMRISNVSLDQGQLLTDKDVNALAFSTIEQGGAKLVQTEVQGQPFGFIQVISGGDIVPDAYYLLQSPEEVAVGVGFPGIQVYMVPQAELPL